MKKIFRIIAVLCGLPWNVYLHEKYVETGTTYKCFEYNGKIYLKKIKI